MFDLLQFALPRDQGPMTRLVALLLRRCALFGLLVLSLVRMGPASAQPTADVAWAGIAYAGAAQTVSARFPRSQAYEKAQAATGQTVHQRLAAALRATPPTHLRIVDRIDELKGRDQAVAVALVIGSETVVTEQFGNLHKLLVLIRGQAMFFDFKSMNVLRTYPISFAYVDLLDHTPSDDEIQQRVGLVFDGAGGKPGLLSRFAGSVSQAALPAQVSKTLQVTSVEIAPEALELLPEYIRSDPDTARGWLADIVGEAISTRAGVPIIPFAKGYAVGNVMSMSVSDGEVWNLKLPVPDFEIGAALTGLKKIKFSEVANGATSYVYGAYAQLRIEDALKKGMNTALKNGETRVIPASQRYVDDFPHFYDAINGLFTKAALAIDGRGDEKWMKSASSAKDFGRQLSQARELMEKCK